MELNNFSIKDVVLGTRDLSNLTSKFLLKSFNYIETSISYNNDFEVGPFLNKKTKIISSISSLDQFELMLKYHLSWLKRKKIDILLVDIKANWKEEDLFSLIFRRGELFDEIGLTGVETIEDVKKIQNLGITPDWVDIIINPTNFNYELISFLKESGIKIISHKVLGGYFSNINIEVYTLQFLLSFAALYSDLVCISGNSCEEVLSNKMILENCIGKEITDDLRPMYVFNSSRIVKRAPLTPLPLHRYLPVNGFLVKLRGSMSLYSPILSMSSELEIIPEEIPQSDDYLERLILETMEKLILPEDCIPDSMEAFAFWRYNVIAMINLSKNSRRYKYNYELIGNTFLIHRIKRFGFKKEKTAGLYILAMTEKSNVPLFRKIRENSNENT